MANVYKNLGVSKGDRVVLYMPMIPEAAYAMLAVRAIGAVHSIVFAGFSPDALAARVEWLQAPWWSSRPTKPREAGATRAEIKCRQSPGHLRRCATLVVERTGGRCRMKRGTRSFVQRRNGRRLADCAPEPMNAEDPLFILYTSGSTGSAKGRGAHHRRLSGLGRDDPSKSCSITTTATSIWCTADVGWVTGHSYIVYGPLANGAPR